jgi:charged multivesicular body protein 7
MNLIVIFFVIASVADAFFHSSKWDALRVTWNINPFKGFDYLPRQLPENKDFEFKDDLCATGGGKLIGQRYWNKQDPTVMLLFDKNGFIAGIQSTVLKSKFTPFDYLKDKNYIDDGDYWTLSAYFIDPSLICGAGRSKEEFEKTGTGTGLWIQMGPNAVTDSYHVSAQESEIKGSKWGHGKCVPTMGQHYWYDVSKDMTSDKFVPNCLLYTGGKLNAFCFATNGDFNSSRYDYPHPKNTDIAKFLDPLPDFFYTDPSYKVSSTIHVYFTTTGHLTNLCPIKTFIKDQLLG